jgi:mono/diheme cytochrome c family protein
MRSGLRTAFALAASLIAASAVAQSPDARFANPARFMAATGEGLYADVCQGCHMPEGVGASGAGAYRRSPATPSSRPPAIRSPSSCADATACRRSVTC